MNETNLKIIRAAQEHFLRYGFKKTSVDEIAAEAGVGKGTIYNYFGNKEELFIESTKNFHNQIIEEVSKEISSIVNVEELIRAGLKARVNMARTRMKAYGCTKCTLHENIEIIWDLKVIHCHEIDEMVENLRIGVEQGIFATGNLREKATSFFQIIKSNFVHWVEMQEAEAEKEMEQILDLIFGGLRA